MHVVSTYSLFNIGDRLASREESTSSERLGRRDDLAAVDHRVLVVAKDGQGREDELEIGRELLLVVCRDASTGLAVSCGRKCITTCRRRTATRKRCGSHGR
jgi:hypothetical protein